MSLHILLLVLSAAFLHALWNLLAKKAGGKTAFIWLQYAAGSLLFLPFLLFQTDQLITVKWELLLWFSLSSALLHIAYFMVLQKGYRSADLSVVYPLARGSGPLFSSVAAILFLHEKFKLSATVGLLLIITGVLIITGIRFKKEKDTRVTQGVIYGVLTGIFIAMYTLNDAVAVKTYALAPLTLTLFTNLFSTFLLAPFVWRQSMELKRELRAHKWQIIGVGVLSPVAYILVLIALKYSPLTVVAPARETSILMGVFMGSRVLGEENSKRRLLAAVLILSGIIALSFY
ncbi:EamA family transporter [Mucilaginibacter corticis]|uniref:EamA family transporter n=1 Tax=Mucilaginibacter corticis TaxID=2597670 RepID=A0A556MMJ6_9SPHI|nr:DMT family transporter [Mucilaginibacter corticis]TSJ41038.1 EamA family transporter [Mucilaginibacter corticis]